MPNARSHRGSSDRAPQASPGEASREAATSQAVAFVRDRTGGGRGTESEGLYRLLVESVRDYAVFALDPTGHILSWNVGAERIKGYAADEIIGQHFSIFYPEERIAERFPQYELEQASRVGRFEDEGWRVRKDGALFWANVVITALRDETGDLVGFVKVTRDLTDRRRAEEQAVRLAAEEAARAEAERRSEELRGLSERLRTQATELAEQTARVQALADELRRANAELRRANAELQRALAAAEDAARQAAAANRAKTDFLAAMSHELRTPLNAIGGFAELLQLGIRGPVTAAQREDLRRIRSSQQHLLAVINDILNFSRIEAGQVAYEIEPVSLSAVLDAVLPLIEPQASAKDMRLEQERCDADAVARADRVKVEQILLNLLSNAVKFTPDGGRVTVTCAAGGDRVTLTVADTGPGVPPENREAIFEPFVQLGRTLTTGTEGTGLGLAISRDLARAMGGDITVDSTRGGGAAFTVALPAA